MIAVAENVLEDDFAELRKVPAWDPEGSLPEWLDGTDLRDEPRDSRIADEAFASCEVSCDISEESLVSIDELASCWTESTR